MHFGSSRATNVEVHSGTEITATSPAGAASTGYRDVTVETPGGTSPVTTADQFIYGPTITSISPTSGSAAGGVKVTVKGTGFKSDGAVNKIEMNLGGASVTPTAVSETELTFVTPKSLPTTAPATDTVQLRTPGTSGQAQPGDAAAPVPFVYLPVPAVTSVLRPGGYDPDGGIGGGTVVTITGTGFTGATAVSFGSTRAAGFTVVSETQITATSPAAAASAGAVNVTVAAPGGKSAASEHGQFVYVPTITGLAPTSGPVTGGTEITLTGTGFDSDGGVEYVISGTEHFLTALHVVSATTVTGVVPASKSTGEVYVVVVMKGTAEQHYPGEAVASQLFTYTAVPPAPKVTSITPAEGTTAGASAVTIKGSGFLKGATVKIGHNATSVTVHSETEITAKTAATAAGRDEVIVSDADGTSSAGPSYTYVTPSKGSSITTIELECTGARTCSGTLELDSREIARGERRQAQPHGADRGSDVLDLIRAHLNHPSQAERHGARAAALRAGSAQRHPDDPRERPWALADANRNHPPGPRRQQASPAEGLLRESGACGASRWSSARPSRRVHVGEVLGAVLAQHLAHPCALVGRGHAKARQQLALALERRSGDDPADGQALEQQLGRPLPGILPGGGWAVPRAGECLCVLAPGARGERAAQREHVAVRVRVVVAWCGELLLPAAAPAHAQPASAARSSWLRTSPVSGVAWPGHAAAGSSAASLRMLARACSVSKLYSAVGRRAGQLRPHMSSV